ncbi:hypothetical protein [Ectopseudomonas khazarica]|uniref:hypothetical protein n=1 Tax=Ectopseudomonas khazarica TaxID=2502979 RepID=UPI002FE0D889
MQAILTCDYLVSPAELNSEEIIIDLYQILSDINNSPKPPLIEDDAYEKLEASGRFPCDRVFSNIVIDGEVVVSANDISKVVNGILSRGTNLCDSGVYFVTELQDFNCTPQLSQMSKQRNEELKKICLDAAIHNLRSDEKLCILHYWQSSNSHIEVDALLIDAEPFDEPLPLKLSESVLIFDDYKKYLSQVSKDYFITPCLNPYGYKQQIYSCALSTLKEKNESLHNICWSDYDLGESFTNSLNANQAGYKGEYFNVTLECISHIIAQAPKNQVSEFRESERSSRQRVKGDYMAYRSHICKSGPALRLMLWKNIKGHIKLANIGPKNELYIAD